MKKFFISFAMLVSGYGGAEEIPSHWFTGPLIVPTGTTIPYGDFQIQPYIYYSVYTGNYGPHWKAHSAKNLYSFNAQLTTTFGLTPWMDIFVYPQFFWNRRGSQGSVGFGDLPVGFDFQLYPVDASLFPGVKLFIAENFPTGKYQHLDPDRLTTDAIGGGTFGTSLGLIFYRAYHLAGLHWLTVEGLFQYTLNAKSDVHGFNTYGGGYGTKGKVFPGMSIQGSLSFEVNFTQNWAFALTSIYTHQNRTSFSGYSGIDGSGNLAKVGLPSSELFTLAPAIEYNFSQSLGVIVGAWLSVKGRNASEFRSGVASLCYTY